jgi:hypothetical protein
MGRQKTEVTLSPKIRQEVIRQANGVCQCHNPSHKHPNGSLKCMKELPNRIPFHPITTFSILSFHNVIAVCHPCADQIRSLGGKILW